MKSVIIKKLEAHIASECTEIDTDEQYDMMLNECYPAPTVACCTIDASEFLKEHDPVAYRCGKNDWLDGQRECWSEVDGQHYDKNEVEKSKEGFLDELNDELENIDDEEDEKNIPAINILQAEIVEVEGWEPE